MSRAVAIAAMPSPRPVRPSPSVVVADTLTEAPDSASLITFSASARRGATRGRFPITCTATLPMTNPASLTSRNVSRSREIPDAPAHSGAGRAEVLAEIAEASRRQQRGAGSVAGHVSV